MALALDFRLGLPDVEPGRSSPAMTILGVLDGLAFSMLVFAVMTFGQNIVSNYDGVAPLFAYMGVTAMFYGLLRFVPLFNGGPAAD